MPVKGHLMHLHHVACNYKNLHHIPGLTQISKLIREKRGASDLSLVGVAMHKISTPTWSLPQAAR